MRIKPPPRRPACIRCRHSYRKQSQQFCQCASPKIVKIHKLNKNFDLCRGWLTPSPATSPPEPHPNGGREMLEAVADYIADFGQQFSQTTPPSPHPFVNGAQPMHIGLCTTDIPLRHARAGAFSEGCLAGLRIGSAGIFVGGGVQLCRDRPHRDSRGRLTCRHRGHP